MSQLDHGAQISAEIISGLFASYFTPERIAENERKAALLEQFRKEEAEQCEANQ